MSILAIGSVALDTIETPAARAERVIGGSATFFSAAASLLAPVRVVAVVGEDYPLERLEFLARSDRAAAAPMVDLGGIEQRPGESFFWAGRYHDDFRTRETLETRLGVFADFNPVIPVAFRDSAMIFLGNIDPILQNRVLDQFANPGLVAADTMNFWIEGSRAELLRLLKRIDLLFVNDEEAMQLSGQATLDDAARWIRARGPRLVVIKRGAEGALGFGPDWRVSSPAYPVSGVVDPTGAGDAFAGGLLGSLHRLRLRGARTPSTPGDLQRSLENPDLIRSLLVHGAVMGSFAVEDFSVDRFRELEIGEWSDRAETLHHSAGAES